jgi:hypothetical protein
MNSAIQPDTGTRPGGPAAPLLSPRLRLFVAITALVVLAAHLPFLASTLDDIDSINFALGIRHFDPALHRPHPPGYPVYIAIGKAGTAALDAVRPAGRNGNEATALAFWSALFAALSVWPLTQFFAAIERGRPRGGGAHDEPGGGASADWRVAAATVLAIACPLFWFTAARPMSDVPGLAMALVAQALLATAFVTVGRQNGLVPAGAGRAADRLIAAGAFASAVAIGFRSQAGWLTLPLLGVVLLDRAGRGAVKALVASAVSLVAGVALWGVPLVVATGGITRYLHAVFSQAGEDFSGVDMFLNYPSARRMLAGLIHTFVLPWGWTAIAIVVLVAAAAGGLAMVWRSRPGLLLIVASVAPYAVFHLLIQETITTRYALPLVPVVAFLAVQGLALLARRFAPVSAAAIAVACLVVAVPATRGYAASGSPLFRALDEMDGRAASAKPGALAMHHVFARGVEAAAPHVARILPAPPKREWMEVVKYWQAGGRGPVWFLADPRRTDLALIDPASRHSLGYFGWTFPSELVMSGVRPDTVEWIQIDQPGWFALQGWALTPETAGVARLDRPEPNAQPVSAWVRHRAAPATLMIGGRNLREGGPAVDLRATFDGRPIGRWTVEPGPRFFLVFVDLPAGALEGPGEYGRIDLAASAIDAPAGGTDVAIEQFDLQPVDHVVAGFDAGWHEQEFSLAQARSWHWTSEKSALRVRHGGHDVVLHLEGESPLRHFDRAPTVVVRAGSAILRQFSPAADFAADIVIPRAAIDASDGLVTIETSRIFVPNDLTRNGDRRHLGLRVFNASLRPR